MSHQSSDTPQSITKMNTRQLGELFVEACRLEKIRSIIVPSSTTKSLDVEIKRMINWKINQKYTSIINFGNLNEHLIRLMVYAQKASSNKSTSKQESSKANIIEQTVLNNINKLVQKLNEMKLHCENSGRYSGDSGESGESGESGDLSMDRIEEELEIERNIWKTLQKKSEGDEKKNILEDTQKIKTLAKTVYKILLVDNPMADRLYREIDIFSRPVRDAAQDTGGNYRLANSDRDRRFKASEINPKVDRTNATNWRKDNLGKTMTFADKPKNSSTYRPKLQDNENTERYGTDRTSGSVVQPSGSVVQPSGSVVQPSGSVNQPSGSANQPSGSVYQPPLTGKKYYGKDDGPIETPDTRRISTASSGNAYVPPHMRIVSNGSGSDHKQSGGGGDRNADFINFDDLQKKKGFNIELNDFPELGGMKTKQSLESKPSTNKQENDTISKPESRFGVLAAVDDSDDDINWDDDSEIAPTPSVPTITPIKAPSVWGNSKSFVAIAKEAEETCRIRKEEAERLMQEEQTRLIEAKKRNAYNRVHNSYGLKNMEPSNAFPDNEVVGEAAGDSWEDEPTYEDPVDDSEYYEEDW